MDQIGRQGGPPNRANDEWNEIDDSRRKARAGADRRMAPGSGIMHLIISETFADGKD
jgi:hypothetical protein